MASIDKVGGGWVGGWGEHIGLALSVCLSACYHLHYLVYRSILIIVLNNVLYVFVRMLFR